MKKFTGLLVALMILIPFRFVSAAQHAAGTNVLSNGTIYMIGNGERRAYTSEGAFLSYGFNAWGNVLPASTEDLALPEGNFIPPRDGKIVCSDRSPDKGTCYLITNGKRSAFVSETVFKALGFSFGKALTGDVSFLPKDDDITTSDAVHKPGVLINKNGTIYLVSSDGLMGIPSPDVLNSWGYSFADAVNANNQDASLVQASVVTNRQGAQLSPSEGGALGNATEDVILQSYIDSYPPFPTTTVSSPQDVAAVLSVNNSMNDATTFDQYYAYFSSSSLALMNKTPEFKKYIEALSYTVYHVVQAYSQVSVYTGQQLAILNETMKQDSTGYSYNRDTVFVKENGTWKFDLIGTMRRTQDTDKSLNPGGLYTQGTGTTNISIVGMQYDVVPVKLNDPNARFILDIKNNGGTKIWKFDVEVDISNSPAYYATVYKPLEAGQEIILSLPIGGYWDPNIILQPNLYRTDAYVEVRPQSADSNLNDNSYYNMTQFVN